MSRKALLFVCGIIGTMTLSGCVQGPPIKEVAADKEGYMTRNFSMQSVDEGIFKQLSGAHQPSIDFKKMKVLFHLESTSAGGNKYLSDGSVIYRPLGGGYVQQLMEHSSNGIPFSLLYELEYGILHLKWQTASLQSANADPASVVTKLVKFEAIPNSVEKKFSLEYSWGISTGKGSIGSSKWSCETTKVIPATTINPKLNGRAIEVGCDIENDSSGVVAGHNKWLFLEDYGVSLTEETGTVNGKNTYTIADVQLTQ